MSNVMAGMASDLSSNSFKLMAHLFPIGIVGGYIGKIYLE